MTTSTWGFALYTPHGRVSDWFRRADQAPQPQRYRNYPARDQQLLQAYIGDFPEHLAREIFRAATPGVLGYERAARTGPQARMRNAYLVKHIDLHVADVPHRTPAE